MVKARTLVVTIRETDGSLTQNRDWSAPADFDLAQARRFSRWQRAIERSNRGIVQIALAA